MYTPASATNSSLRVGAPAQEAGPSKTLNQMETVEIGLGLGAEEDIGALLWDEKKKEKGKGNLSPRHNKCFNCGTEGHGIKDCQKLKNQCTECKFHGGGHRTNCSKYVAKVRASTSEQTTAHSAPSVAKDPFAAIRRMDFEQMQAYFWDKKDLAEKQEKGKAQ